ncbi:hypothetical protein LSM04_000490 [Trypanosoma melophagium]|uniref:uncharacterized protein n=1 Tax=Trypanosoma melophagium TaxID=715481 RepID=UPI00351A6AAA|nr:hypothetical protein LSM04_000490 [Trypanosoma melophagium]
MPVSPQYRRFQQLYYLESSERDAGVSHLWHAQRLAEERLRTGKGITDAPNVDFRHPELMDTQQAKASALMTRLQRRVLDEEQRIVKGNTNLYENLIMATDTARRERRGMNNVPTTNELQLWYRRDEHMLARQRDRAIQEADKQRENRFILQHLISTQPAVTPAKQLDHWYKHEHKKRLQQLSRFKRREPFAGGNILRKECKLKLNVDNLDATDRRTMAQPPPLWQQHKVPSTVTTLESGPVIPSLQEASQRYIEGNRTLDFTYKFGQTSTPPQRGKKPEWKTISALDTVLINYANDMMLARGGEMPVVQRDEENGVTRLWREGVEKKYNASEKAKHATQRWDAAAAASTFNAADSKEMKSTTVRWEANRWKSRTSVLTLLRDKHRSNSLGSRSLGTGSDNWDVKSIRSVTQSGATRLPTSVIIREPDSENTSPSLRNTESILLSPDDTHRYRQSPHDERKGYGKVDQEKSVKSYKTFSDDPRVDSGVLKDSVESHHIPTADPRMDSSVLKDSVESHNSFYDDRKEYEAYAALVQTRETRAGGGKPSRVQSNDVNTCETSLPDERPHVVDDVNGQKQLSGCRSLVDWTNELRRSNAPFAPY